MDLQVHWIPLQVHSLPLFHPESFHASLSYAVVTPLRKAASYEPRIAILEFWVIRG